MKIKDMAQLRKIAGIKETTHDVLPATPRVESDIAQDIANMLFQAAESQTADIAADEGGHGFSGNVIMTNAQKIVQRALTFLDDKIKQFK
jgi:hypothetical protein